jgi:hypothetical protein
MLSLPELMEQYIKDTKRKIDFNKIPEQIIHFTKNTTKERLYKSYRILTDKETYGIDDVSMINEIIYLLLKYMREIF